MHQFDEEADESHDQKPNASSFGNGREFLPVRLGAFFDEVDRVLGKLLEGLDEQLLDSFLLSHGIVGFFGRVAEFEDGGKNDERGWGLRLVTADVKVISIVRYTDKR